MAKDLRVVNISPLKLNFAKIQQIYIGTKGINTLVTIISTIELNSSKTFNKELSFTFDMPIPKIKARTKADITPIIAGISIVKYVATSIAVSSANVPCLIKLGRIVAPAKYANNPATIVETYAMIVVINNPLPDFLPKVAIPGTINPIIINGMTKDKKLPKMLLKVTANLTGHKRPILLHPNPKIIPKNKQTNILEIKDIFFINTPFCTPIVYIRFLVIYNIHCIEIYVNYFLIKKLLSDFP